MTRGFHRRRGETLLGDRLPPGQYVERGFPVLSAGPTPRVATDNWDFAVHGAVKEARRWTWDEFFHGDLPRERITKDIHCVTSWSKFDTAWEGISVDAILERTELEGGFAVAECDGGYTTNLALDDLTGGKAWVVDTYDGKPLPPEHGGPARLLVPHLYFWKSAKWVRRLLITTRNEPGFWETLGYHDRGDPWREQRYAGD
jgi:DMSO/TMAO reductase YedYZ molybdopterin-dependent catalytic subunit